MDIINLLDLNDDVLLHILSYLDARDILNVHNTCVQLRDTSQYVINRLAPHLMMTGSSRCQGRNTVEFDERATPLDRLTLHCNWIGGNCVPGKVFSETKFQFVSKLHIDPDHLYLSNKGELRKYARDKSGGGGGIVMENDFETFGAQDSPIISTFVVRHNRILTGSYDGTCSIIDGDTVLVQDYKTHTSYRNVLAMDYDVHRSLLASSNHQEVKIFLLHFVDHSVRFELIREVSRRARSLQFDQRRERLMLGNVVADFHDEDGFIRTLDALSIYNLACETRQSLNTASNGVLDLIWYSPDAILTANWDGSLRLFDLNCGSDVMSLVGSPTRDQHQHTDRRSIWHFMWSPEVGYGLLARSANAKNYCQVWTV